MSAAWDLGPMEERPLFGDRPWPEPEPARSPVDATLMLALLIVAVMLVLTVGALVLFRGPLSDLLELPA
ncbi:MAG: hypothetical protein ACXWYI_07465, partial [Actinomycetota bacterium]